MKLRKTILTTLLLSFFSFGFTAQASIQSCNQAHGDLRAAIAMYGSSPPGSFGWNEIQNAQNQVTLACTTWVIGGF